MMDSETDGIINELIDQNLKELEHQKGLEESERWGSRFYFWEWWFIILSSS